MTLRDLYLRGRALLARRRVERELDEELAFHLEREMRRHLADGRTPADARARALARFGSVPLAADQCRDARGTAVIDTVVQDVRYACTMFRRAPLSALTIVATVALGLGLVAVVFSFYSALFLRVDAVRHPGELFEVRQPPFPGAKVWEMWTRLDYDALRRDTHVFSDAVAVLPGVESRVDGRLVSGTLVTGNFFQVLGVEAMRGRVLLPDDDRKGAGQPVVVLSHAGWTRLFADDPAAIGRSILLNGAPYTIVGVAAPGFYGLATSPPDYWAPLDLLRQFRPLMAGKEDRVAITTIGRLGPHFSRETATTALTSWAAANPDLPETAGHPKSIALNPIERPAADVLRGLLGFAPLFVAFGLVLLIGCANVANLLLARGVARQRELGVRLSLGASRGRIIRQLLTESLLLALAAAVCAFGASRLMLTVGASAAGAGLPPDMAERVSLAALAADWRVVAFLLVGAVASTVCFGLAPALQATRLELVRTMRGEVSRGARPSGARQALVALQVTASTMLVICAAVFLRSAVAAASVKPGVRTVDTMSLQMGAETLRPAMLQAVSGDPAVSAVAAAWPNGLGGQLAEAAAFSKDTPAHALATVPVEYKLVSPEYFQLLDIALLRGRGFRPTEREPGAGVVLVSETTARRIWPDADAIGQIVRLNVVQRGPVLQINSEAAGPQLPFSDFTVVGVVRDAQLGLGDVRTFGAGVYVPTSTESAGTSLVLRVRGDPDQARLPLIQRLSRVDPTIGAITTLRSIEKRAADLLRAAFWVTVAVGGLALALTLSGLFSVLSYLVEQRSKEIGVRMALGAASRQIGAVVLSQSLRPVVFGLVAGAGLALSLAKVLVATGVLSSSRSVVEVYDPVAYGVSTIVIGVACAFAASLPAWRATRIDPIAALRND